MSNKKSKQPNNAQVNTSVNNDVKNSCTSSWTTLLERYKGLTESLDSLPVNAAYSAISRAFGNMPNFAPIQNTRVKSISPLPFDLSKEQIGDCLRNPYSNEKSLRQVAETLKYTSYPFYKTTKLYQDISTYHNYFKPCYVDKEEIGNDKFMREAVLLDKLNKKFSIKQTAHKITGQAITQGKVFYTPRYSVDKTHNKVNYAYLQQLPTEYCQIIGFNNISGYTVSFNLMYFTQVGTDIRQFGDLFLPYFQNFHKAVQKSEKRIYGGKTVYASINMEAVQGDSLGNPKAFMQDGVWFYWVSLPIDKVWTFEIDDTTAACVSPLSGLFLTDSQQADYEDAQLSLLLNPLIKIFTGSIPYFDTNGSLDENAYRLSPSGREFFEQLFDILMAQHNTSGTAFYMAPVNDIKSHDFKESANANDISKSFQEYRGSKAGLNALLPATDDIKGEQVKTSQMIESQYTTTTIYPQFEKMLNCIYETLNLNYEWEFKMFGTIFTDKTIRENAKELLDSGDTSQFFVLCALDDVSWIDKLCMVKAINKTGFIEEFNVLQTAYTQSAKTQKGEVGQGRPQTDDTSDSKEHSIDAGIVEEE